METSQAFRNRCDRIWAGLHAHPFLGELARGTLPLDRFRFFIEQDLLFLPGMRASVLIAVVVLAVAAAAAVTLPRGSSPAQRENELTGLGR